MKRLSLITLGIAMLLLPLPAAAAGYADAAVSPLVQETIERLDEGLMFMEDEAGVPTFAEYFVPDWLRIVNSNISLPIDTQTFVIDQTRDLLEFTPCLRADIALLTAELDKVHTALNEKGIEKRNIPAILAGTDAVRFGSARLRFLIQSGTDPLGVDEDWKRPRIFEAGYEGGYGFADASASSETEQEKYCPFTTKYLPPTIQGGGCGVVEMTQVINNLRSVGEDSRFETLIETIEAERDALATLQGMATATMVSANEIIAVQQELDELSGIERWESSSAPSGEMPNDERSEETLFEGCTTELPSNIVLQPLSDGFSLDVREEEILFAFSKQWQRDGRQRAVPKLFQSTGQNSGVGIFSMQQEGQRVLEGTNERAEEQASQAFAVNADPVLALSDALSQVEISVGRLATLATSRTKGLSVFALNFARYLLSSCVDRPCKKNLEAIVRILTTRDQECLPFTSGKYLEDTDSRADKCRDAAGIIEEEGF